MLPDDDAERLAQKNRARKWLLAAALGFCAMGSTAAYLVFLRSLGWPLLTVLMALEWLVMLFVFLIATSRMRPRRR
jgi:hypothetical protein